MIHSGIIAQGKDISTIYNIYDFLVAVIITLVFSITTLMIVPFVVLYTNVVNDVNYIVPSYALLFCVWAALYSYRIPITAVINAAGIYRANRWHNAVNIIIQIVGGIIATLIWGVSGLLVVMIVAALHRNITLTMVNSKQLLHTGVGKCILRQSLMILIIVSNFLLAYYPIKNAVVNIETWILCSVIVSVLEFFICGFIFGLTDIKITRKTINLLKSKIKKRA